MGLGASDACELCALDLAPCALSGGDGRAMRVSRTLCQSSLLVRSKPDFKNGLCAVSWHVSNSGLAFSNASQYCVIPDRAVLMLHQSFANEVWFLINLRHPKHSQPSEFMRQMTLVETRWVTFGPDYTFRAPAPTAGQDWSKSKSACHHQAA